jgi:hypothetical protein
MKKLVTAFAACALAGLVNAQVESVNIVGYQTLTASGRTFSTGPTFVTVGDINGEWTLGDITASGMDPMNDFIQFLDTTTASTYLYATYIDEAASIANVGDTSMVGWWDLAFENSLDSQVFSAGVGFLSNFTSTGITFTYAGEVLTGPTTLDLSSQVTPMVSNFLPVDLILGDLTVSGMDPMNDFIQFLNTTTASTYLYATYIDEAASIANIGDTSMVGWWDLSFENSLNSQQLPAGAAFLGNFTSTGVMINFPDPVAL